MQGTIGKEGEVEKEKRGGYREERGGDINMGRQCGLEVLESF